VGLYDLWNDLRGFWSMQANQVQEIERARHPERYKSPMNLWGLGGAEGGFFDSFTRNTQVHADLYRRYVDYEQMDDYPELSSALDSYADEATQADFLRGQKIWVESPNIHIASDLNFMLHKTLKVDNVIWEQTRYLCKMGNGFERMLINENGVIKLDPLPATMTRVVKGVGNITIGYIASLNPSVTMNPDQFRSLLLKAQGGQGPIVTSGNAQDIPFEGWEVSHFALRGKERMTDYGYSIMEPARWVYRRLVMMEDAVLVHKLTRASSRNVFYVNTGDLQPDQAMSYALQVRNFFKRQKLVRTSNGTLDSAYNPLAIDEDFFIPVHRERGEAVRVDSISGSDYQGMEDTDYFRKKLGRAIKIPNFGRDDDAQNRPLSQEDFRFAAAVMRVQRAIIEGYYKVCDVHLIATGRDPRDFDYKIMMTVPSAIIELARVEVMSAKADILGSLREDVSIRWLLVNLYGFSEDEAVTLMVQRQEELDYFAATDLERQLEREKIEREVGGLSESNLGHSSEFERKLKKGALGVTRDKFMEGSEPDRAHLRRIAKREPRLAKRLDRLEALLNEIKRTTRMNSQNREAK